MENKEFKRIWEKEGKRLFDLEQKKGNEKPVIDKNKVIVKGEQKPSLPYKRKGKAFSVIS